MKVQIKKSLLIDALEKIAHVSTRALVPDYNHNGLTTVEVRPKEVLFSGSNGHLSARYTVTATDDTSISANNKPGVATIDSLKFRDAAKCIATQDDSAPLTLSVEKGSLVIEDASSKRKKRVKLPIDTYNHPKQEIRRPSDATAHVFESDHFIAAVNLVSPFVSRKGYKPEYTMLLFHWINNEVRFVCGNGSIFGLYTVPQHSDDKASGEKKRLVPVDQILIINSLIPTSQDVTVFWDKQINMYLEVGRLQMSLKGIPDPPYIAYDTNAFRFEEAKAIIDVKVEDLLEATSVVSVLHDKEKEGQGEALSCFMKTPSADGLMKLEITEKLSKFQCEYEVPMSNFHDLGQVSFNSLYANSFLQQPAALARHSYLRFYLIDEKGVMIVRDADLLDEKDSNGIVKIKDEPDGSILTFFFSDMHTTGEEYDDGDEG